MLLGQLVPGHDAYLSSLERWILERGLASLVDVVTSAPPEVVLGYLHTAVVQWHLTGIDVDGDVDPASLEHFGISIVEGMSAGCIPVALRNGGPSDIIRHGRSGFLARNASGVMAHTLKVFGMSPSELRVMWQAVTEAAAKFSYANFEKRFARVVQRGFLTRPFRFFIANTLPLLRRCTRSSLPYIGDGMVQ